MDTVSRREQQPLLGVRAVRGGVGNPALRGALNAVSKRRVGISGTEGLKQRTLCEGASPSAQLIHQELHDDHKKPPTRRLPRRRQRPSRSAPRGVIPEERSQEAIKEGRCSFVLRGGR